MKTASGAHRRLVGGLIILIALAAAWAVVSRQGQRAERERRSPLYQSMPVLKACGVHLTGDDEHMLGHHGAVPIPFQRLSKPGKNVVRDLARKELTARAASEKTSEEEKKKKVDGLLKRLPNTIVGFQRTAPGSAYVYFSDDFYLAVHVVPGTNHVEKANIDIHEHHGVQAH